MDNVNPSASKFIVQLSCLGFQLVDVQLDEQHPTQSFSVSFDIVIVTGEIGIDSIKKRIYASISLKHPFGEKKYEFDLYNWGNIKVQTLQLKEDTTIGDNSVLASMNTLQYGNLSGSITVKNRGRYLAKFKVSFKLNGKYIKRESESFGYLVNKTINVPADATDITLEVLAGLYLLGTWSSIFTDHFDTPVNKTYKLTGDVFNPDCIEIE